MDKDYIEGSYVNEITRYIRTDYPKLIDNGISMLIETLIRVVLFYYP